MSNEIENSNTPAAQLADNHIIAIAQQAASEIARHVAAEVSRQHIGEVTERTEQRLAEMSGRLAQGAGSEAASTVDDGIAALREGMLDPVLNVKLKELIYQEDHFIVYLDDELRVQYRGTCNFPDGSDEITFELARLESLTFGCDVDKNQLMAMRRLLGEIFYQLHVSQNTTRAKASLMKAEQIITNIVADSIRYRRVIYAAISAASVGLMGWLWIKGHPETTGIGPSNEFGLWLPLGAVGALLSSLRRMSSIEVKPFTGKGLAFGESAARIIAGAIGALLLVAATKSNLMLGVLGQSSGGSTAYWGLMTLSLLAGASERLVPDFIDRMDSSSSNAGKGGAVPAPPGNAGKSENTGTIPHS